MVFDTTSLTEETAEQIVSAWLEESVTVLDIKRLHGGMINSVLAFSFDSQPQKAVCKVSSWESNPFLNEFKALEFFKNKTNMPVPEPFACGTTENGSLHYLLMEMLPGVNLGEAKITNSERNQIEIDLADILTALHHHKGDFYGHLDGSDACSEWREWFRRLTEENYKKSLNRLSSFSQDIIPHLIDSLPLVFAESAPPALVHSDIWCTNVMVNRSNTGWYVSGLVDVHGLWADPEYELAYLEVFWTASDTFFRRYHQTHPRRTGYETRKLYYWLNTMMLHVWLFGDQEYISRTNSIVKELKRLIL